jgi:hypothetical protein
MYMIILDLGDLNMHGLNLFFIRHMSLIGMNRSRTEHVVSRITWAEHPVKMVQYSQAHCADK